MVWSKEATKIEESHRSEVCRSSHNAVKYTKVCPLEIEKKAGGIVIILV